MNPLDLNDSVVRMNTYLDMTLVVGIYLPGTVDCLLDLEATPVTAKNRREMYTTFTPTRVKSLSE